MKDIIEIVKFFLGLGCFAFGGPAAHIAMMHREVVLKKKWIKEESFIDLIGLTSLIPGPNSTEMVMHCGYAKAGKKGIFLAGIAFIVPATFLNSYFCFFI